MASLRKALLICGIAVIIATTTMAEAEAPVLFTRSDTPVLNRTALYENIGRLSHSSTLFSLDIIEQFSDTLQQNNIRRDIMISPFAIWSLLLLLMEGANGNTLRELRTALHVEDDPRALRQAYSVVQKFLKTNGTTIEVASLQAIFTDINQPVHNDYSSIIERDYGSNLIPVDFQNLMETYLVINDEVNRATRGLIPHTILPQDLMDANLFLLSSLYFKGQWRLPFNKSLTRSETFYGEDGKPIGEVQMMVQEGNYNFTGFTELKANVLELPYGKENRLSMLVMLPRRGATLNEVVHNLRKIPLATIFQKIAADSIGYEGEDIEVLMPKFSTTSDFSLTRILQKLGINEIFDDKLADLSKMADNLFVSQIIHSTKIIVNEEGTEAAAVTSAVLSNKATPSKFYLNRPFLYLIIEKTTNLLLFAGQVTNPNNV